MEIFETALPGVGVRYEFETVGDDHLGVVVRRDGHRDLVVYDRADPDASRSIVALEPQESAALVELLGGTKITERLAALRYDVEGLSIEWVTMLPGRGLTGHRIGDGRIRTVTGCSVVAVIRGEASIPGPGPDFTFSADDVVLVMGAAEGVRGAISILTT